MAIRCYLFYGRLGEHLQWYHVREGGDVVSLLALDLAGGAMERVEGDDYAPPTWTTSRRPGMSAGSIEAGVPLFDSNAAGAIWVYYPTEKIEGRGWRCDMMVLGRGEVLCRAGLCFSNRFLASLFEAIK